MGEKKFVPQEFVEKALIPMAGMRNILVHHYADIDAKKLYETVKNHRGDIETFLKYIKEVIENPKKWGLEIS